MQHQTIRPRTVANDYVTVVQQACEKVKGFADLYWELKRSISINGKSQSCLVNYSRQLAHLALHYDRMPLDLDPDQVMDYLHFIKCNGNVSPSFFNFTVHGMRYVCKMRGLEYKQYSLPGLKGPRKLPVILNGSEIKAMLRVCTYPKHRLIIGLCYGCGLRASEIQYLKPADADLERGMLHIRQGKGSKDRCLPLGELLCRGIQQYLIGTVPAQYLFGSSDGVAMTRAGVLYVVKNAKKKAGITKDVHTHTLRHTYATHLLEQGVNILIIKDLLGHKQIETTMTYLHVAKPMMGNVFSPLDSLYGLV